MWHLKPALIPAVMGALGIVKNGTNNNCTDKRSIYSEKSIVNLNYY